MPFKFLLFYKLSMLIRDFWRCSAIPAFSLSEVIIACALVWFNGTKILAVGFFPFIGVFPTPSDEADTWNHLVPCRGLDCMPQSDKNTIFGPRSQDIRSFKGFK